MKMVFLVVTTALLFNANDWLVDFDQAKQIANAENKMIVLSFSGSDWCAPCIKLEKDVFESEEFMRFANDNLVLVRADFPRHKKNQLDSRQKAHNEKLAEQYNPKGKFPLTLLLNADGHVMYEWDGYSGKAVEFVNQLKARSNAK